MREYTVNNQDFTEFDQNKDLILTKVDRNNTHHYTSTRCPKCGGTGYIDYYDPVDGGVCFLCGGTGKHSTQVVVRTAEYQKKLNDKRLEKARKTAGERNAKYLHTMGFSEDGRAWLVMGNTYEIKDQLKASHCRWDPYFGWHFDHLVNEFPCVEISINDKVPCIDESGNDSECTLGMYANDGTLYMAPQGDIDRWVNSIRDEWKASQAPATEYFGDIGDKVYVLVKVTHIAGYETQWGYTNVFTFEDLKGHQFVWKTGSFVELDVDDVVTIKGTIKDHSEYKFVKQTELTRCKVSRA